MADEQPTAAEGTAPAKEILLQKIYIKDLSFESPKAPEVFMSNVNAQTQLNIRSANKAINDENVEVSLTLTIKSENETETMFLIEIVQAGIFAIRGYNNEEVSMLLGSFCPSTLYPFAREAIADIATKGGFPQLLIQPINFDALYAQFMQERAQQEQTGVNVPQDTPQNQAPQGNGETH